MKPETHHKELPSVGFVRMPRILELIPVSRTTWLLGVKTGKYPQPVSLGLRAKAWRWAQIRELIEDIDRGVA
jgi:prophage regulatory protein